ncbi:MAG: pentapeptide repeat-containing protein, partial [Bacteroidota bacterium]
EKLKRLTGNPDFDLHIIITSRKGTVDPEKLNAGDFLTLQLEGLDKDQQDQWLSTYRKFHPKHKGITHRKLKEIRKEEHFSYLKELIEQPILLYLIAKSEIFPSHDINRSKIYQELFDQLIERAWDEGQIPALKNIAKEDLREFLGDIALKIWQSPNEYITKKSLASLAKANGPFAGSNEDLGFLLKQVMVSFYFRSVPKDVEDGSEDTSRDAIEFLHKSLMEYLAAEKIWGEIKYLEEKTNKGRKYAIETSTKALSHLFPIVASKIFHQEEEKVDDYLLELIRADGSNNHELSERLVLFLPGLLKLSFIDISQSNSLEISLLHQGSNTFFNYWNVMEAVRESCGEASRQLNLPQVYYDFAHSFRTYTAFQPSKLLLKGWRFKRLYLSGSQFKSSELENIKFTDSALEGVNMYSSNLVDVTFYRAQMNASNFTSVNAFRINFDFATLGFCSFRFSNITEVSFHESYLGNTSFDAANLSNVNFNYANLIGATFHKTNISDVDFSYAELDGVDLSRANMKGISLKGASLKNAYLRAINLNDVLADESKFINSYLREGKLKSASLKKVDFEGADLSKVDFKDAKLEGANFKGANLYLANFQSADLYRAKGLTVLQLMEVDSLRGVIGLDPDIEESIRKRKGYLFS